MDPALIIVIACMVIGSVLLLLDLLLYLLRLTLITTWVRERGADGKLVNPWRGIPIMLVIALGFAAMGWHFYLE